MPPKISRQLAQRLRRELVIWLTTVRPDGMPQPTPVWFLWDGDIFLVYSQPSARKLCNIAHDSKVALNLNSDEWGSQVVVIAGEASLDQAAPPANRNPGYMKKYREGIAQIEMTPESMASEYSVAIRVKPIHVRNKISGLKFGKHLRQP
jgi:PPOX class probable F420-dependent enzyme